MSAQDRGHQVNAEDLFLRPMRRHSDQYHTLEAIFRGIIERSIIGANVAILDDEADNFTLIKQLAELGLKKL